MGKLVQILFRIIIHIISQLINKIRRTVSGTEETTGDPVFYKRLLPDGTGQNGFPGSGTNLIFKSIDPATQSIGIFRPDHCTIPLCNELKLFLFKLRSIPVNQSTLGSFSMTAA